MLVACETVENHKRQEAKRRTAVSYYAVQKVSCSSVETRQSGRKWPLKIGGANTTRSRFGGEYHAASEIIWEFLKIRGPNIDPK